MSIRKVNFVEGEYYHIYNRGNSKQKIFHDKEDFSRFVSLLYSCNSENNFRYFVLGKYKNPYTFNRNNRLVSIGAYCLMPNHFHIMITEKEEGGISKFMQKLSTAYAMFYNKKYEHSGGIFEGKFKSVYIENDIQAKYLFSYIHLNPVKLIQKDWKEKGIKNKKQAVFFLKEYMFSSYLDFLGVSRIQSKILNIEDFPRYFLSKEKFNKEIIEWLEVK